MNCNELIKLFGKVQNHAVKFLIDSSATHNFIDPKLVKKLNLPIQRLEGKVTLANGNDQEVTGITHGVPYQIGLIFDCTSCSVTQMTLLDEIILGKPWLVKANPKINWRQNTVTLRKNGRVLQFKQIEEESWHST